MIRYLKATFASLAIRNYRLFFIGQAISQTGSWMQKMAQGWLVLELTDSGVWLGLVLAVQQLPTLLLTAWGGLLADRHHKRTILIWVAAAGAMPALLLGLLAFSGHISIEIVMALALAGGLVDAVERPARQAFPSEMVGRAHLANAVTLSNVVQNSGKAVGPAIAGVLISLVGFPWTFLINAASFSAVIWGLVLMDPRELHLLERVTAGRGQVREGLRYVQRTPTLLGPLILLAATGLLAYNFQVMLPLLARNTFDGDARLAGTLLASLGIGSVVGGLALAGVLNPTLPRILLASALLAAVFAAVAIAPTTGIALGVVFVLGAVSVVFRTQASTWLQLTAEPIMRGRVMSLLVLAIGGTTPIGAPLSGWLDARFGTRTAFAVASVSTIASTVAVACYLNRRSRRRAPGPKRPDSPARRGRSSRRQGAPSPSDIGNVPLS